MEKLSPEQAVEVLRNNGIDVSVEETAQILQVLRMFANIVVSKYLENQGTLSHTIND